MFPSLFEFSIFFLPKIFFHPAKTDLYILCLLVLHSDVGEARRDTMAMTPGHSSFSLHSQVETMVLCETYPNISCGVRL